MDANCVGGVGRGAVSGSDGICDVGGGRDWCGGGGGDSFGETNSDSGSDIGIFFRNPGFRRRGDCLCYQVLGSHGMRDRYGAIRGIPDPRIRGGSPGPNRRKRARTRPRQPK